METCIEEERAAKTHFNEVPGGTRYKTTLFDTSIR
jgi:hypothetical protein